MGLIKRLRQSEFLRHNAVFFFGSVGVGVLNYLYYPVLGRLLEPAAFGEVQALVSLFLQFTIFLQVLNMVVVNVAVNYGDSLKANRVIFELEKLAAFAAVGLLVASLIFGPFLREVFQFESAAPFTALALALLVSVPLAFRSGYVRAHKKFGKVSLALGLGAGGKIILSAALVAAGLGTLGAILGIAGAQIIALAYAAFWATKLGFKRPDGTHYARRVDLKTIAPELKYAGAVLAGSLSVMLLMSMDVLFVKKYFDPETAGLYAGVATVARAIFFFTASVALVLLPSVKLTNTTAQNRALLLKSLTLLLGLGGAGLAVCVLAQKFLTATLIGEGYSRYADLLPALALAMLTISLLNLLFMYFLALRLNKIALVAIIGFAATFAALAVNHGSLQRVVSSVLIGSIVTMCLLGFYIIISKSGLSAKLKGRNAAARNDHRSDLQ